jgi:hypothetical protein
MKVDFDKFKGTLPYASELFGVFQPLLGWKSKRIKNILDEESAKNYSALAKLIKFRSGYYASTDSFSVRGVFDEDMAFHVADEIDSLLTREIASKLNPKKMPSNDEWQKIITVPSVNTHLTGAEKHILNLFENNLKGMSTGIKTYLNHKLNLFSVTKRQSEEYLKPSNIALRTKMAIDINQSSISTLKANVQDSANFKQGLMDRENLVAQSVLWLSQNDPSALNQLFFQKKSVKLADITRFVDPLQNFGHSNVDAVLSPVGIVHLFRQYFFEFDTFLGPPAGHIWISPGGTVELVEISSRKTTTERTFETIQETVQRTEQETTVQDELSDAVKEENRNDIKFGFSASAKYSSPFFEAQANTSLNLDSSRTTSRETTQKHMREQSEKLSSEIKRSFKSTFKVATEVQETSSKRYVIQNTTDKLINYELRRKMRQVGVQVQDINTQLCWQVFVDDPGRDLGVAKLVHIAEPADLSSLQPPEAPVQLPNKSVEVMIQFAYENAPDSEGSEMDVTFYDGDDREGGWFSNNDKIIWVREYQAEPPAPDYTMDAHIDFQVNHSSTVAAEVERIDDQGKFRIILHQVNFDDKPSIDFKITTYWNPSDESKDAAQAAYLSKVAEFNAEKSRKEKEAYVKAAQERITMASKIQPRKFEELREEERIVVYRKLVKRLMSVGDETNTHIMSELIRSIFDVDNMLYFVAPEWWRSRLHQSHQSLGTAQPITEESLVSWGGATEQREDNYHTTDESQPARLGSSLGWLLQLDGDNLRNAFLNSPWVKAVIPLRPGKETAALNWLQEAHVEGSDGLDAEYHAAPEELKKIKAGGAKVTIKDALEYLAKRIQESQDELSTPGPSPFDPKINVLPTEVVYEHGFNPLAGGVKVNEDPFRVFSQWIEVLPTDQIVALEYNAADHL